MNTLAAFALAGIATASAGIGGASVVSAYQARKQRAIRRAHAYGGAIRNNARPETARNAVRGFGLRYAAKLTTRLFTGATAALSPSVRAKRAEKTRYGRRFAAQALSAGCSKDVTVSAFVEAATRLAIAGLVGSALFGALFSWQLAIVLGITGCVVGHALPARALASARRERAYGAKRHLSEMLETLSLGLRSGLTFDRSFALYGQHFDSEFAQSCAKAQRRWSLGLTTREEALHDLAASYDCEQLSRIVDTIIRSLRFGSSLTVPLEEAAAQARAAYRASLEERVAKAPVKMMLPTGTLILPAMLLLVMGPILLELAGGF